MPDMLIENGPYSLEDFIETAARIEDRVAEIYDLMGTRFSHQQEFALFWRLCAEAERYHAASIRLYRSLLPEGQAVEDGRIEAQMKDLLDFMEKLDELENRCGDSELTGQDALGLAIEIESHCAESHGRSQFGSFYPDLGALFEKLAEEERVHRRTFTSARTRFSNLT